MDLQWRVNINESASIGWYQRLYTNESISMNQHLWLTSVNISHQVDIDYSNTMGCCGGIYTDKSITMNMHQRVNIGKYTSEGQYRWIYLDGLILMIVHQWVNIDDLHWHLISTNLPNELASMNLRHIIDNDKLIMNNLLQQVNIYESTFLYR